MIFLKGQIMWSVKHWCKSFITDTNTEAQRYNLFKLAPSSAWQRPIISTGCLMSGGRDSLSHVLFWRKDLLIFLSFYAFHCISKLVKLKRVIYLISWDLCLNWVTGPQALDPEKALNHGIAQFHHSSSTQKHPCVRHWASSVVVISCLCWEIMFVQFQVKTHPYKMPRDADPDTELLNSPDWMLKL